MISSILLVASLSQHLLSCEDFYWITAGLVDNPVVTAKQRSEIMTELILQTDPACFIDETVERKR